MKELSNGMNFFNQKRMKFKDPLNLIEKIIIYKNINLKGYLRNELKVA